MRLLSTRSVNVIGFILCCALLIAALFIEYARGVEPCMLCMLQRCLFAIIGIVLLIAIIHKPLRFGNQIYWLITLLFAILGVIVAGRQVWLQMSPPQNHVELCAPGLTYMLNNYPIGQTLLTLLHGSDSCAKISFQLLGLTLAEWTLVFFGLFILLSLIQIFRRNS